jgi:hypothetical protein
MNGNGADALAHLVGRVAELEAAQRITARALETTWRARLTAVEQDVDVLLELLATGGPVAAALTDYNDQVRRARTRASEGKEDRHEDRP